MILSLLCENAGILRIFYYLNLFRKILFIVLPIILILVLIGKLYKALVSNPEDASKEISSYVQKIGALIIVFFIPGIITIIVSWISSDTINTYRECNENATIEKIEYYQYAYEEVEKLTELITRLEKNPIQENYDKAEEAYNKFISKYNVNGEVLEDLHGRMTSLENLVQLNEERKKACESEGGVYTSKSCNKTVELPETVGDLVESSDGKKSANGMISYTYKDIDYWLPDTPLPILDAVKQFQNSKLCQTQSSSFRYKDKCLCFAEQHTFRIMGGKSKANAKEVATGGKNGSGIWIHGLIKESSTNKNVILKTIYKDLTNGKVVILHVAGSKSGNVRHYVTVIGFKQSVKSAETIKDTDLLILDSDDALIEPLYSDNVHKFVKGQGTLRFMNTGKMCGKDYDGYQIYRCSNNLREPEDY